VCQHTYAITSISGLAHRRLRLLSLEFICDGQPQNCPQTKAIETARLVESPSEKQESSEIRHMPENRVYKVAKSRPQVVDVIETDETGKKDRALLAGRMVLSKPIRAHDVIDPYQLNQARMKAQALWRMNSSE